MHRERIGTNIISVVDLVISAVQGKAKESAGIEQLLRNSDFDIVTTCCLLGFS